VYRDRAGLVPGGKTEVHLTRPAWPGLLGIHPCCRLFPRWRPDCMPGIMLDMMPGMIRL